MGPAEKKWLSFLKYDFKYIDNQSIISKNALR